MPPELIYLPPWFPINIYKFASWARCNIIPLTILRVHQPVYALPNGLHMENNYIDELWVDLSAKSGLSFTKPYLILALTSPLGLFFQLGELFLWIATKLRLWLWRRQAISACVSWILTRQETSGDWAGIYPPMHLNILALLLEGFSQTHPVIQGGLAACERFLCEHPKHGKWMQASISPVWDTFLMVRALSDTREAMTPGQHGAQENKDDVAQLLIRPVAWLMEQQINDDAVGDWRIYRPGIPAGGFAFEYFNRWYPDVDDTAVGIVALLRLPDVAAQLVNSQRILAAAAWVMGMQNKRGGWAAFDADNNAHYLHATPFSDMESLCDDSTPDVTGHVLEMFGLMYLLNRLGKVHDPEVKAFLKHSRHACIRGIEYLVDSQETFGGWYGRWGVNYIFGTNAVLVGLAYFVDPESDEYHGKESLRNVLTAGIDWLRSRQNTDGGWGECVESYTDKRLAGYGKSTPSQTAWALLGLLEFVDPRDSMIQAGVDWLLQRQVSTDNDELKSCCDTGTWYEPEYTATGFPGHFYLRYELYSHYFPMTALARHASLLRQVLEELNVAKASG
ncbi:hypothetical protein MCOR25_009941 [Pyricularia grisea]|nr:hypothetical protein MCOR25_009941 [Pyricularia grisea]